MKKRNILITVIMLALIFALTGCAQKDSEEREAEQTAKLEFTDDMRGFFDHEGLRIPEFDASTVESEQFAYDFIFYFYTGKNYEARETKGGAQRVPWHEEEVGNMYRLLFGKELPPVQPADESTGLIYDNGYYWVWASDFGDVMLEFNSVSETDNGLDIVYDYYVGEDEKQSKIFSVEAADNERGYIITQVKIV